MLYSLIILLIYIIIILFSFLFIRYYIREIKFKNQKYLTKDTTILITGGCLGIGKELINLFISLFNCKIINLDIRSSEFSSLKSLYGDKIQNINCDISKIDNIILFLEKKGINPDKINIIINNAAIANNLPIEQLTMNKMISTIEINLLSPMKIIKAFIENNKKNNNSEKIHFVTLCSVMSHIISANSADYISSKWGLYAFVECIRNEYLYNSNYIFTTICPFAVNTGMFPNFLFFLNTKYVTKEILKSIVLKENIKFIPDFINLPIYLYKLIPSFLSDLIQHYIINHFSKNIGRRIDNDELFK